MTFDLLSLLKKKSDRTVSQYKQELLMKQGREQFKKLIEKGLELPVVLL